MTPVVAVLRTLKATHPQVDIRFWCDSKFYSQARGIIHHFDESIPVERIFSGKLRRFHNVPLWRQLIQPNIILPNIRDFFLAGIGFIQSLVKLVFWRPDVVFTKGGFVCLPVGFAAKILGIPLVIHDSDAHPGLTNRILAKWATSIATGAPLEYYNYPPKRTKYIGIPVGNDCVPSTESSQRQLKRELGVDSDRPLVVITGGGLGARRINNAVLTGLQELLPVASVILVSGAGQYDEVAPLVPHDDPRFQLHAFVTPITPMLRAADVVIARAGATTLLELAAMAKPTILVPNGYLTGGHQLKNAAVYAEKQAVVVIDEHELDRTPAVLVKEVKRLVSDTQERELLAKNIHTFAKPRAADDMAVMILAAIKRA